MACLEHACTECDWSAFNNHPGHTGGVCPNCGGRVVTHFDEELDRGRDREPPEPEEEAGDDDD